MAQAFAEEAGEDAANIDPQLHRSKFADYQADAAMGLARKLSRKPRDIAQAVAERIEANPLFSSVSVAGPGFLNLDVSNDAISQALVKQAEDEKLAVPLPESQSIVVDYSSPNVAKEMHVGHLRSTIIGDACVRLLEWLGHTVIRRNHIGDWGTPFGMLIEHLLDLGESQAAKELSIGDLNGFYRGAREKFESDETFQTRARDRVVSLQAGDAETLRLWNILIEQSKSYFQEVYARMDVRLDGTEFYGESAYNDLLSDTLEELRSLGLIEVSDGAECLFPDGFSNRDGDPLPLIVRKRDGGYGYAATDLAAIRQRAVELKAQRILYVVGAPQSQHLEMVYAAARAAGWLDNGCKPEHIAFGSVLGVDGKMFKSRAGESTKLVDLLIEAEQRAGAALQEKNPDIAADAVDGVIKAVGIGSVKYADLSSDRTRDYAFDFDRMLAFEGNTAPYIQYAHARIQAILRKAAEQGAADAEHTEGFRIDTDAERALAMTLVGFSDVVLSVAESLSFHHLATYLFDVATQFSKFYSVNSVLDADTAEQTQSRLILCRVTAKTLETGLALLGIRAPQQM